MNQTRDRRSAPLNEAERLTRLQSLADLMDNHFTVPGTNYKVGLDFILGLVPGVGDTIGMLVSAYILREAHLLGAPGMLKLRMSWNILVDWLVGIIPFVGDLFDAGFKANRKNVRLLERHLRRRATFTA